MSTIVRSIILGASVAGVILAGIFGWQYFSSHKSAAEQVVAQAPYQVPPPGDEYTNSEYHFSLTLPQGFAAREMENVVVIEDGQNAGIQIVVTPIAEDIPHLTAERIAADVPDMNILEPQEVEIGEGRTGLAFKSDNQAFDGASREVWFVFDMQLYQISTYAYLDPLLQAVFSTWEFF